MDLAFALDTLVRVVERQSREFVASVLLLSDDGGHVVDGAGPSLPDEYRRAINGLVIGAEQGSCGTAAFRNERVIVSDIRSDPLWEEYRELAAGHGLVACWSQPIRSRDGAVLGTFAMYYREPRAPTPEELELVVSESAEGGLLSSQQEQLIQNIFDFGDRRVGQVMTPRPRIAWVSRWHGRESGSTR